MQLNNFPISFPCICKQDPSIQQVTKNTVNNAAKDLEDYNPFDDAPQRPTTVPISSSSDAFDPVIVTHMLLDVANRKSCLNKFYTLGDSFCIFLFN